MPTSSLQILRFPEVRKALEVKSNKTVHAWCQRWGIDVINLSARSKAIRAADLEHSLQRASGKELANVD